MITENMRINELSPEAARWYIDEYLAAMDARDVDAYVRQLSETCELCLNNADPVRGRGAIRAMLSDYWKSFAAIEHDLLNLYGSDRAFMLEALNHYARHDGSQVTLRAVALTDRDDSGLVTSVRLYTDTGPLFS